jgi:hypothetical protein
LGVALIVGAWMLYFAGVTLVWPYPLEYREGASQVLTQLLLAGKNPFALENQPLGMTNYGIGFNLMVWPLAALFGNTLLIHRLVTLVFILLASFLVLRTASASVKDPILPIVCAELVAAALATRAGLGALPGAMGTFLFLLGILLPLLRGFDRWGLFLSGLAILLAFYTKPYFLLGFGVVASYLFLFVSKKKGLIYIVSFGAAALLSVLIVRAIFPLYFFDTVFSNLAQTAENQAAHLYRQLKQLGVEFFPALIAALVVVVAGIAGRQHPAAARVPVLPRENLRVFDRPLFSGNPDYLACASICSLLAFVLILGPNPETYMNYSYQLIAPPGLLWLSRKIWSQGRIALILTPFLVVNLVWFCWLRLGPILLRDTLQSASAWEQLYATADRCQRTLNSPLLASEMIRLGQWPVDSGQTQYYFSMQEFPGMRFLGPSYAVIAQNGERYLDALRSSVAHREFDCIITARFSGWPRNLPLDRGPYELGGAVKILMPQAEQNWRMDLWVPAPQ